MWCEAAEKILTKRIRSLSVQIKRAHTHILESINRSNKFRPQQRSKWQDRVNLCVYFLSSSKCTHCTQPAGPLAISTACALFCLTSTRRGLKGNKRTPHPKTCTTINIATLPFHRSNLATLLSRFQMAWSAIYIEKKKNRFNCALYPISDWML